MLVVNLKKNYNLQKKKIVSKTCNDQIMDLDNTVPIDF